MSAFTVNATLTFSGWVYIEANTPEDALAAARELEARDFDYDPGSGMVEFNVTPEVVAVTKDGALADAARSLGADVHTVTARDPYYSGWEISVPPDPQEEDDDAS